METSYSSGFSFLWICGMLYTANKIGCEFFIRFDGGVLSDIWEVIKFTWFWWFTLLTM